MAETKAKGRPEGWEIPGRKALWIAAGFFGALAVFIAAVALFYRLGVADPRATTPSANPRGPAQATQRRPDDRLPVPQTGPPTPTPAQAEAIDRAMGALAAKGDAGWAPLDKGSAP